MLQFVGYLMFFKDFGKCFTDTEAYFFNPLWSYTNSTVKRNWIYGVVNMFVWERVTVPISISCSHTSFHQTNFRITQQKLKPPDFKQHQTTIRGPNIRLQAGERSLCKTRGNTSISRQNILIEIFCSSTMHNAVLLVTHAICWRLSSCASHSSTS